MSSNLTCIWSTIVQASEMAPDQKQQKTKNKTATQNQTSTCPMNKFMIQQSGQKNFI